MSNNDEKILKEIDAVKRLLILLNVKLGSDSNEIAMALGLADSTVRKIMSFSKIKKIEFPNKDS